MYDKMVIPVCLVVYLVLLYFNSKMGFLFYELLCATNYLVSLSFIQTLDLTLPIYIVFALLPYQASDSFKKKLLIFGRISTYKGCEFIVPLAHELAKRAVDCRIVVAGKALDDVQQQMMDGIAKCDNVELINEFIPENELHGYFYATDASLILHKSISQSGVIIDAYRHGHPIICFDIEGISEFIGDNTALVAPTFDISKMADNIETLYKSHGQYLKMSRSAYEFGKKVFSEVEMANSVMKFISEETKR